jgi:hypothetical protein
MTVQTAVMSDYDIGRVNVSLIINFINEKRCVLYIPLLTHSFYSSG